MNDTGTSGSISAETVPDAWRWRHRGSNRWEYGEEEPTGPSIHLFEVQRLSAVPAGWQPIETAPRDGTRVLLWTDTKADPEDSEYLRSTGGEDFALAQIGQWEVDEWDCLLVGKATHWMPLPEPPK